MREALAEALSDFEGAIVMVSHDRHLIGLVCDNFWRVADGVVEPFSGDLDDYAAWLRSRPAAQGTKQRMAEATVPVQATAAAAAPVVAKKPVNPVKLAAAEKKVSELERPGRRTGPAAGRSVAHGRRRPPGRARARA